MRLCGKLRSERVAETYGALGLLASGISRQGDATGQDRARWIWPGVSEKQSRDDRFE